MAGALMQLVAYGAQDVYLTGNPQITFFKVVYRRHTNFAMESMRQVLNGRDDFGNKVTCKLSRNGDLVGPCYVQAVLPALNTDADADAGAVSNNLAHTYTNAVGFRLLREVQLRIGGQLIDKQSATWMYCWNELTQPDAKAASTVNSTLERLVGATNDDGEPQNFSNAQWAVNVPLQFFFCRNPGLALPLIALQYHEVEISIELESLANCTSFGQNITGVTAENGGEVTIAPTAANSLTNVSLFVDYFFLDTEERKTFAQNPHEYLIETVQEQRAAVSDGDSNNIRLTFNHPVKELVWVVRDNSFRTANNVNVTLGGGPEAGTGIVGRTCPFTDFLTGNRINLIDAANVANEEANNFNSTVSRHPVREATLKLNGQDRFAKRPGLYFSGVQPYQHHTGNPDNGICSYSFALNPEDHQPSGTCNFSRIDNAHLNLNLDLTVAGDVNEATDANGLGVAAGTQRATAEATIFAHGYNVLRVASGMGGLAYSN